MKQLLTRIEGLEKSIISLVEHISALKEERNILSNENSRLLIELNQLRKSTEGLMPGIGTTNVQNELIKSDNEKRTDDLKKEVDECIKKIEYCLEHI